MSAIQSNGVVAVNRPLPVKVCYPTGGPMDIPSGSFVPGTHGQMVLNAGIAQITGYVGPGNCFKTTIMRCLMLRVFGRIMQAIGYIPYYSYDTEINNQESRNNVLIRNTEYLDAVDLLGDGVWQVTDRTVYKGNEWYELMRTDLLAEKMSGKARKWLTAFLDRDNATPLMMTFPTFFDFDSLSAFITGDVEKMQNENEIGDSGGNTIFMRQGLAKKRMLDEMPTLCGRSTAYVSFTAHIGAAIQMPSAPGTPPPRKQLQHMNANEVIKGVTNSFFYLLHNCWLINNARPLLNQGTKGPEYPFEPGDERQGDLDLNIVNLKQLRGKNGTSGYIVELLVSQREGVLFDLSNYHTLKTLKKYGMGGNDTTHYLELLPEEMLRRTTVRQKLRESLKLRRAMEITCQLAQTEIWHPEYRDILMEPKELYAKLKEMGYDWDWILTQTRAYNIINDEEAPLYPLSTLDLCRIARGLYHPYYLESDCKTVQKKYVKKSMEIPL